MSDPLTALLSPGYEPGDGSAKDAQQVDADWWHPIMGCDSLQKVVDNARDALLQQQPPRVELPKDPPEHLRCWLNVDQPDNDLDRFARVLATSVWHAACREVDRQQGAMLPTNGEVEP